MRAYDLLVLAPALATIIFASCGGNGSAGNAGADGGSHVGDGGNGSGGGGSGGGSGSSSGGGSSGGGSGGGSGSSSGSGSGSSSGSSGDAGMDAAPSDASGPEICATCCTTCVQMRCDATAQACAADPTCSAAELGVEQCINACPPNTDCSYCSASASSQVLDLYNCRNGTCILPCLDGVATSQTCSPLGDPCDPLDPGYACCVGDAGASAVTCYEPGTSLGCCVPEGSSCDPNSSSDHCCNGGAMAGGCQQSANGNTGTCSTACYPIGGNCDSTLPCCNSQYACTDTGAVYDGGPESYFCCAKDSPMGMCATGCPYDAGPGSFCGFSY
jgi:hypothetical protein